MGKKKPKKTKKSCCGNYLKKSKHCSRCPILVKEKCKALSKEKAAAKKKNKKKSKKKK